MAINVDYPSAKKKSLEESFFSNTQQEEINIYRKNNLRLSTLKENIHSPLEKGITTIIKKGKKDTPNINQYKFRHSVNGLSPKEKHAIGIYQLTVYKSLVENNEDAISQEGVYGFSESGEIYSPDRIIDEYIKDKFLDRNPEMMKDSDLLESYIQDMKSYIKQIMKDGSRNDQIYICEKYGAGVVFALTHSKQIVPFVIPTIEGYENIKNLHTWYSKYGYKKDKKSVEYKNYLLDSLEENNIFSIDIFLQNNPQIKSVATLAGIEHDYKDELKDTHYTFKTTQFPQTENATLQIFNSEE